MGCSLEAHPSPLVLCDFLWGRYFKKVAKQVAVMGAGKLAGRSPPIKSRRGIWGFKVPPHKKSRAIFIKFRSPPIERRGLRGVDGVPMGCGWGADEACLRARGGPMLRGSVDALER